MTSVVIDLLNSWYINGINLINNLVKTKTTKTTKKRKLNIDEENDETIQKRQRFY